MDKSEKSGIDWWSYLLKDGDPVVRRKEPRGRWAK